MNETELLEEIKKCTKVDYLKNVLTLYIEKLHEQLEVANLDEIKLLQGKILAYKKLLKKLA